MPSETLVPYTALRLQHWRRTHMRARYYVVVSTPSPASSSSACEVVVQNCMDRNVSRMHAPVRLRHTGFDDGGRIVTMADAQGRELAFRIVPSTRLR
tara:strand:- start:824 stop:1114 length:291 start_codon:yes stop_codon:yes gene_type:complete